MVKFFAFLGCVFTVTACTIASSVYPASVGMTPAYDVHSDNRVAGTWALYVYAGRHDVQSDVLGRACSAHEYPLDMASAFSPSAVAAIKQAVESVQIVDSPLSSVALNGTGYAGQIILKSENLRSKVGSVFFAMGGYVEMTVSMTVDGRDGRLFSTTIVGEGEARASESCPAAARAVGKAAERALQSVLTTIVERISTSPRMRDYVF